MLAHTRLGLLLLGLTFAGAYADDQMVEKSVQSLRELGAEILAEPDAGNEPRHLALQGEQFDDEAIQPASAFSTLHSLSLRNTKVTGRGLRSLGDQPELSSLAVWYSPLTDRDIETLAGFQNVTEYTLYGTRISDMGVQRLRAMLKKQAREATITFHRGAFLGVTASTFDGVCMVSHVLDGTAAAEGGIEPGDVIVGYAGKPVANFETLVRLVGESEVGEAVAVEVTRGGRRVKMKVTLQRRDLATY